MPDGGTMENPQLELADRFIGETAVNLFLTGRAGTGKTTFLRRLRERSPKRMIVVAPTGVAAINAGGVTIHSFFQLAFAPYIPESVRGVNPQNRQEQFRFNKQKVAIIRSIDLLVIDEISMVRADVLDAVSDVLRRYRDPGKPFGGVQLLLIGDLQQLAPVVRDEEFARSILCVAVLFRIPGTEGDVVRLHRIATYLPAERRTLHYDAECRARKPRRSCDARRAEPPLPARFRSGRKGRIHYVDIA